MPFQIFKDEIFTALLSVKSLGQLRRNLAEGLSAFHSIDNTNPKERGDFETHRLWENFHLSV
ncbi:MAG: hypothetical protein QW220_06135, partial [Candidatus Bathyarchaeia archaeon]